jgi:uncharacterized membrane-anchored protein YjiN (DUF445 family)
MSNKELELAQSKRKALYLLLLAAAVFIITFFLPKSDAVDMLRVISEASMVGALADWFAVYALFKPIPIPFISAHTAIIPRNKNIIADSLSTFVKEKFLDVDSIANLIAKHDPARSISDWLVQPENAERLGNHLVKVMVGALDFIDDQPIEKFIMQSLHELIDRFDLSKSAGTILETLTKNNRHQELLNKIIKQVITLLQNQENQKFLADKLVQLLQEEFPFLEKIIPSEWIGKKGVESIVSALYKLLNGVTEDENHSVRKEFDSFFHLFIKKLKEDIDFTAHGDDIKEHIKHNEPLKCYAKDILATLRQWLVNDLHRLDSIIRQKIILMGHRLGESIAKDADLRESINQHLLASARSMSPDFSEFLTKHIRETIRNWDAHEMSHQIEINIGKDLQFIRINGTIVGGLIGFILYIVPYAISYALSKIA